MIETDHRRSSIGLEYSRIYADHLLSTELWSERRTGQPLWPIQPIRTAERSILNNRWLRSTTRLWSGGRLRSRGRLWRTATARVWTARWIQSTTSCVPTTTSSHWTTTSRFWSTADWGCYSTGSSDVPK